MISCIKFLSGCRYCHQYNKRMDFALGTEFLSDIRSPFDFTNKFTKSILENGKISIAETFMVLCIVDEHPTTNIYKQT